MEGPKSPQLAQYGLFFLAFLHRTVGETLINGVLGAQQTPRWIITRKRSRIINHNEETNLNHFSPPLTLASFSQLKN